MKLLLFSPLLYKSKLNMEKLQFLNDINVRDEINLYAHDIK